MGPSVPSSPTAVTPQPPVIAGLSSSQPLLPTAGGATIVVSGTNVGAVGAAIVLTLTNGVYTLVAGRCSVVNASLVVSCASPVGVGTNYSVVITVDDASSAPFSTPRLSYAPPSITALAMVSSSLAGGNGTGSNAEATALGSTSGGTRVAITGSNFGASDLSPPALGVVFFTPIGLSMVYTATDCVIATDHAVIECTMGPGVGVGLTWTVTVGEQTSTVPRTGYRPPVVTGLAVLPMSPTRGTSNAVSTDEAVMHSLSTTGGDVLVFYGASFGPVSPNAVSAAVGTLTKNASSLSTVATATGTDPVSQCSVVSDAQDEVRCVMPAGVGAGFTWSLLVGGVATSSTTASVSYAAPTIASIAVGSAAAPEPDTVPTAGGSLVVITGANFGPTALYTAVVWNGKVVPGVTMPAQHTQLSFQSPPGHGSLISIDVVVGGQMAALAKGADVPSLRYASPFVSQVSLIQAGSTMVCDPTATVSAASSGIAYVVLQGGNFGSALELLTVTIGGDPCTLESVADTRVVCETTQCFGG